MTKANKNIKKDIVEQMEAEIIEIEKKIKAAKYTNLKIKYLKRLKLFLKIIRLLTPYLSISGIITGIFCLFGNTPFQIDEKKQYLYYLKELDSNGNIRYEYQYDHFSNHNNTITYYDKWQLSEDGFYKRNVKVYAIDNLNNEETKDLVSLNKINSIEDILGEPLFDKIEKKNNLDESEINNKAYLQAIIFYKDENNYKILTETISENEKGTILWAIISLGVQIIYGLGKDEKDYTILKDYLAKLKEDYPLINSDELAKKLTIKRDNYDRLTR